MSEKAYLAVSRDELQNYLIRHGWFPRDHPNQRIVYFETTPDNDGDYSSLTIPASDAYADISERIIDAIRTIADHEKLAPEKAIDHIKRWDRDILKARVIPIHGTLETLPLNVAAEALNELRQFIGYAAYTQSEPRPFFEKAGSISKDFTKACRFGHTFHGSFGFNIECPIDVVPTLPMDGNEPIIPFERQVMERLATGWSFLRESILKDDLDPMITGYEKGFNANMCRSLECIYKSIEGRRIEYDISWSPELSISEGLNWMPFLFEGRAYEFIRAAADALEKVEKVPDSLIEGRIVALKSEMPPAGEEQEGFERFVTMFWEREKSQTVNIRVPLSPEQYVIACDAHKEGRQIRILGIPEKSGKHWLLTHAHDFCALLK